MKAGPSKGKMKIYSKCLKERYYEEFLAQLQKIVYGDQGITMNLINYVIHQI
jgi:hypothetical protein